MRQYRRLKWVARAKSVLRARWLQRGLLRSWAGRIIKSKMLLRLAWSTTLASPAIRSEGLSRSLYRA